MSCAMTRATASFASPKAPKVRPRAVCSFSMSLFYPRRTTVSRAESCGAGPATPAPVESGNGLHAAMLLASQAERTPHHDSEERHTTRAPARNARIWRVRSCVVKCRSLRACSGHGLAARRHISAIDCEEEAIHEAFECRCRHLGGSTGSGGARGG